MSPPTSTLESIVSNSPLFFVTTAFVFLLSGFLYATLSHSKPKTFLNNKRQTIFLNDKIPLTKNTYKLRFKYTDKKRCLFGLPAGQHVRIYCPNVQGGTPGQWNKKIDYEATSTEISRKYTPVTTENQMTGFVDFIIKVYEPLETQFPDGGKVSQYLGSLKVGDSVQIEGPVGHTTYQGFGTFLIKKKEHSYSLKKKYIGMIAGGTGITPMLQVLHKTFSNLQDTQTFFWLIYANRSEEDIIERNLLEELENLYPEQLRLWYVVDRVEKSETWKYSVGYIDEKILTHHLPEKKLFDDSLVLLCGPPLMTRELCQPLLLKLGWKTEQLIYF